MISVITPCLNEADNLAARAAELACQDTTWEWIVVDGGSKDRTVDVAKELDARVVHAPKGRGIQLDAGARQARGDIFLFLHADTALPPNALSVVQRCLSDADLVGGHFTVRFAGERLESRMAEALYRVWQWISGVYFGDSTIFVPSEVYWRLGGFPDQLILEDVEFVRRLEAAGETCEFDHCVTSSNRRYHGRLGASVVRWLSILGLYRLGVPADMLARLYPAPGE